MDKSGLKAWKTDLRPVLAAANIERIEASFSGGNDEGGVDSIKVVFEDGTKINLKVWGSQKAVIAGDETLAGKIAALVDQIVYSKYYTFAGDFSVRGDLVVDVLKGEINMEGEESNWDSFRESL